PRLRGLDWTNFQQILTHDYWWPSDQSVLYRPLTTFSYLFNYGLPPNVLPPGALVSKKPDPGTYVISGHNIAWMKVVDPAWRRYNAVDRIGGMWVYRF